MTLRAARRGAGRRHPDMMVKNMKFDGDEAIAEVMAKMDDSERRKVRKIMDASERRRLRQLADQLDGVGWGKWDCIGMDNLVGRFGRLIAHQLRAYLTTGPSGYRVMQPVLDAIADWSNWHSHEFHGPETQQLAEALDAVNQAARAASRELAKHLDKQDA